MSFNIKFSMDTPDFGKVADKFVDDVEIFLDMLADFGVERAKENLNSYDMPWSVGELSASIHKEDGDSQFEKYVIADGGHASYVEYGTGVVGANASHPNPEREWAYDVNNHGNKGWYYNILGNFHWTKGIPSRPFMYRTSVDMEENALKIAEEVFK